MRSTRCTPIRRRHRLDRRHNHHRRRRRNIHHLNLRRDEDGATMVEYGLLVALIAMVALVGITLLGTNLQSLYTTVAGSV
jgi:pilus assembly protein Flp/PilA